MILNILKLFTALWNEKNLTVPNNNKKISLLLYMSKNIWFTVIDPRFLFGLLQVNLLFLACAVVLLYVSVAPVEAVSTHCGYHYHYNEYFTRYYSSYYRRYYPTYYGCCKNEVCTCIIFFLSIVFLLSRIKVFFKFVMRLKKKSFNL